MSGSRSKQTGDGAGARAIVGQALAGLQPRCLGVVLFLAAALGRFAAGLVLFVVATVARGVVVTPPDARYPVPPPSLGRIMVLLFEYSLLTCGRVGPEPTTGGL